VGRFELAKNHRFMIDLAQSVTREKPNTHFLFVGSGALEMECRSRVEALGLSGQITFTGSRPDTARLMKGAMDLFILPSWHEGLPLVLLEAQAAGLRSLVSDTVTREAAVGQETVKFLPLASGTLGWTSEIVAAANEAAGTNTTATLSLKGTQFDIDVSTQFLMNLYQA
jgi:glycosyltransferase involved in cell wall biosynthesis